MRDKCQKKRTNSLKLWKILMDKNEHEIIKGIVFPIRETHFRVEQLFFRWTIVLFDDVDFVKFFRNIVYFGEPTGIIRSVASL